MTTQRGECSHRSPREGFEPTFVADGDKALEAFSDSGGYGGLDLMLHG